MNRKLIPITLAITCLIVTSNPVMAENATCQKWIIAGSRALDNGDDRGAASAFMQAVMADPSNMPARRLLARAELQGGRATRALQIMQVVIRCQCTAENLACLGDAHYALADLKHARIAYEEATKLDPQCQAASFGLVNVLVAEHQYGPAQTLCRKLLAATKDAKFAADLTERLAEVEQYGKQTVASQS